MTESPADQIDIPTHHPVLRDGGRFSLAILGVFAAAAWAEVTNPFGWNSATYPNWYRSVPCSPIVLTGVIDIVSVIIAIALLVMAIRLARLSEVVMKTPHQLLSDGLWFGVGLLTCLLLLLLIGVLWLASPEFRRRGFFAD